MSMTKIEALSKDTLRIYLDNQTVEVSTGDRLVFQKDCRFYEDGDYIVVEPERSQEKNEYLLKAWSETMSVHYIGEPLIIKLFEDNIVEINNTAV